MAGKPSKMRQWIRENAAKAKDREEFIRECIRRFDAPRKRVLDAISEMRKRGMISDCAVTPVRSVPKPPQRNGKGIFRLSVDVSEIKREYDEEAKILDGIEALGTRLIKDNDFRLELDVPIDRWKVVTGLAKFTPYKKELKGKRFRGIYWGNPEVIKELAKKIDML